MTPQEATEIVDRARMLLTEHFDAVQIMATWNEEGTTRVPHRGSGNWYARQGMAHEFIHHDQAQDLAVQIAERIEPPTQDDSDTWKKA